MDEKENGITSINAEDEGVNVNHFLNYLIS
jgi:hypothetical protein